MGNKASLSKGTVIAKRAKIGGRQLPNSILLRAKDFDYPTTMHLSGTITTLVASGVSTFGWDNAALTGENKITTSYVTPNNLPADCKTEINLFWASSGVTSGSVVFDIDYRVSSLFSSGTFASATFNYTTSGVLSNATTTYNCLSGAGAYSSGFLQKSTVTIPATDTKAKSLNIIRLYRNTDETADTCAATVQFVLAEVSFVDA